MNVLADHICMTYRSFTQTMSTQSLRLDDEIHMTDGRAKRNESQLSLPIHCALSMFEEAVPNERPDPFRNISIVFSGSRSEDSRTNLTIYQVTTQAMSVAPGRESGK